MKEHFTEEKFGASSILGSPQVWARGFIQRAIQVLIAGGDWDGSSQSDTGLVIESRATATARAAPPGCLSLDSPAQPRYPAPWQIPSRCWRRFDSI